MCARGLPLFLVAKVGFCQLGQGPAVLLIEDSALLHELGKIFAHLFTVAVLQHEQVETGFVPLVVVLPEVNEGRVSVVSRPSRATD